MKYANEGMDCKKLLLLFIRKIWVVAFAAILGAVLGGGIYLFYHLALSGNREYQAISKLYLYFFTPDGTEDVYQSYNGYTWNDLMSTNKILDGTMSHLPDSYTEEEVIAATRASILSDIRLLTITITTSDPNRAWEILKATDQSLVEMGEREIEFTEIEVIAETEAKLVTADSRLLQAVLTGLVIVLILSLIAMALVYVLDDRIYVPGDLKCVTRLPFVGFHFTDKAEKEKKSGEEALLKKLNEDMELNRAHLMKENGTLDTLELSKKTAITEDVCDKLRKADGAILIIPYGKMDRTSLAYRIDQLALQECKTVGIIIKDADMRFMKWYYNNL